MKRSSVNVSPEVLGRELARGLGPGPGVESLAAQRAALVARVGELERAGRVGGFSLGRRLQSSFDHALGVSWQRWSAATAALLLVLAVGWTWREWTVRGAAGLTPQATLVGGDSVPVGSWLQATGDTEVNIAFSEGTELALKSDSRARLQRVAKDEVVMLLEAGTLHSSVTPGTGVRWTVEAGPYRVHVLGTVFDVVWDADAQILEVDVARGKVRVSGGQLNEGQPVRAGMRLESSLRNGVVKLVDRDQVRGSEAAARAAELGDSPQPEPAAEPVDGVPSVSSQAPMPALEATRRATPSESGAKPWSGGSEAWRRELSAGDYAGAVRAAEQHGFARLVQGLPVGELLQLGDAARLSGNAQRAEEAYTGLRKRFAGSSQAQLGAYALGRLAVDVRGDDRQAVRWFRVYLREGPGSGQVAAGARARLMDSLLRLGDRAAAERVARDYLRYHPAGRHRVLARRLVSSPGAE